MRAMILQFVSAVFATVGLIAICVSLAAISPAAMGAEPLTAGCQFPSPCDGQSDGDGCNMGNCSAGSCNGCCECAYSEHVGDWGCFYNGNPACI
jgi:hypothetical protein